ncbi:MAG: glucose sorbosone dehydrogenase, partial [Bacteroidetes bacterium]|nr:glucose sorbosone dehydrogenase [Bacteroidota bacterium]
LSVTGGFVYRGTKLPRLIGKYIYADYLSGRVWALEQRTGQKPENTLLFKIPQLQVASFGVDQNQELYICSFDGHIYRLEEK